jgi:NADPH:quinone reductase
MTVRRTHALVVTKHGGPQVLEIREVEVPDPGPGQALVRVEAAGVNFVDVYQREGVYPTEPPFVLGSEGAGVVEQVGQGVTEVAAGDRVAWAMQRGSAAGLVLLPAEALVPVPEDVPSELAAATLLQGMTAHFLVSSTYALRPGDWALVHAAAGGVGQLLVQMAKSRGATVVGAAGSPAKVEKARALGADHVINYSEVEDLAQEVRGLTGGVGVHVAYDGVGKATFDASLASLRIRGLLALFGAASGQVPPFDIQRLNAGGSLYLTRPTLAHYITTREELLERGTAVLKAVGDGSLRVEIGGRYPLADAAQAYRDLEGRKTTGKLLLIP